MNDETQAEEERRRHQNYISQESPSDLNVRGVVAVVAMAAAAVGVFVLLHKYGSRILK